MQKLRKNKKFVMGATILLTAILILSATYAWFTASDSVDNEFKTGGIPTDSVKIWELFEKPTEWKPGEKIQKDVGVTNLGTEEVFVRATFEEMLTKLKSSGTNLDIIDQATIQTDAKYIPVPVTSMEGKDGWKLATTEYTVNKLGDGDKLFIKKVQGEKKEQIFYSAVSSQGGAIKANFELKDKTITVNYLTYSYYEKNAEIKNDWLDTPFVTADKIDVSKSDTLIQLGYHDANMVQTPAAGEKWFYNAEDGWFYYLTPLKGGEISPFFLGSVTLDASANNTYQYLDFKLTVKSEGIQGTAEALASWGITETSNAPLYKAMTQNLAK